MDLSISAQLKELREYAKKNGYVVVREYMDEARSGSDAERTEFRFDCDVTRNSTGAEGPIG